MINMQFVYMVIITYETIKNTAATAGVDKGCEEVNTVFFVLKS
jgi:hypothetical protein